MFFNCNDIKKFFILIVTCLWMASCISKEESDSEICFVGDSIIYLWDLEYYFPNETIVKHAVIGAVVQDFDKWDLSDCENKKTVVLIGTNNLGRDRIVDSDAASHRTSFIKEYKKRILAMHVDQLIAVSLLPRNSSYSQDSTVNMNIQQLNRELHDTLRTMNINFKYVDVFDKFIDKDYKIKMDYFDDGLHPSKAGYDVLAREVEKKL